jgi:hypothetical protein
LCRGSKSRALRLQGVLYASAIVAFLVSCGPIGGDDPGSGAGASRESAVGGATPLSGAPLVGPVIWATSIDSASNRPGVVVTELKDTDPFIYAVVQVVRIPAGTDLRSDWSFENNSLDELATTLVVERDLTEGWIEFHLHQVGPEPRPDGVYAIRISSLGADLAQGQISVVKTDQNS